MATPMTLEMQPDGVLVVRGDVEETGLPDLRATLDDVVDHHHRAWVDLSETNFLPSAAIGVVARATGRALQRGSQLTIVAAAGSRAARILTVTGLAFEGVVSR